MMGRVALGAVYRGRRDRRAKSPEPARSQCLDRIQVTRPAPSRTSTIARVIAQPTFPALRVGLHVGPVVERDDDYFGATVNIAARVAGVARTGEIVCTERVASVATDEGLAAARPMGTVRLKNVARRSRCTS